MNAIEMTGILKIFPGVIANDHVDFSVKSGEIHALLGENGAGKSTLMSILFGLYQMDSGEIRVRGERAAIRDPNDANALGIGMVHQHFKLVHNFTVAENIVLGLEPTKRSGSLDLAKAEAKVSDLSERYGLAVNPRSRIEDIGVGMQQRVEILKILYRAADILIFDEPTAVLTPAEVDELILILKRLKAEGKTIVLITHKLKEIKEAADRCTVLRRGKLVGVVDVAACGERDLAEMMVGRTVNFAVKKGPYAPGRVVLKIDKLTLRGVKGELALNGFSLEVRAGEIVGLAGVDGNGQSELVAALAGILHAESGSIFLSGHDLSRESVRRRVERGLGLVPEDRHKYGLVLDFRLDENLALKIFRHPPLSKAFGFLDFKAMAANAKRLIDEFDIRSGSGPATLAKAMSGGNQQKALIAREIDLSPACLVVSQPTRGLDVGAIENIHRRLAAERDKGRAVLLVSYDLDEILNLCDRVAAVSKGRVVGVLDASEADERRVGAMMAGITAGGTSVNAY